MVPTNEGPQSRVIWRGKWGLVKVLFLIARYPPFVFTPLGVLCTYSSPGPSGTVKLTWTPQKTEPLGRYLFRFASLRIGRKHVRRVQG
jgi:hypothetical protein